MAEPEFNPQALNITHPLDDSSPHTRVCLWAQLANSKLWRRERVNDRPLSFFSAKGRNQGWRIIHGASLSLHSRTNEYSTHISAQIFPGAPSGTHLLSDGPGGLSTSLRAGASLYMLPSPAHLRTGSWTSKQEHQVEMLPQIWLLGFKKSYSNSFKA